MTISFSPLAIAVRRGLIDGLGAEDIVQGTAWSAETARRIIARMRETGELTEIMELRRQKMGEGQA